VRLDDGKWYVRVERDTADAVFHGPYDSQQKAERSAERKRGWTDFGFREGTETFQAYAAYPIEKLKAKLEEQGAHVNIDPPAL
jgi:hypothetical protein